MKGGRGPSILIRMMQTRRTLLSLLAASVALPAFGQGTPRPIPLDRISAYIQSIGTAETDFTQVNPDGSISSGRVFLHRPNRMRFEYNPPDETLVLAAAGQVAIFDGKSTEMPEEYPLRRTPLNLILGRQVDLGRADMVVGHISDGFSTAVIAQDPEHPEYGTIRLIFTDNPLTLRQWIVTDEYGNETAVMLGPLVEGKTYPPSFFSIVMAREERQR